MHTVAAIQMISGASVAHNLARAGELIAEAASAGATLVLLPEYWVIIGHSDTDKLAHAEQPGQGPVQDFMAASALLHHIWLIGGTLPLCSDHPGKVCNTTLVYDPLGQCVARYDKMHLFGFCNGSEAYDEARTIVAGKTVASFEAPLGRVGLSVCYDLRFPELYRALGSCALIVVPAAFTHTTGLAHWEILLRARAIENQCYVLAAAQGGLHENGRRTWGHSMLIDPWGHIVAQLAQGEGVITGEIDAQFLRSVRANLPALTHRIL